MEPKTLPPILPFEDFRILILKTFIGRTIAAKAETIRTSEKLSSLPSAIYPIRYGDRKINSDIINNGINNPTKIIPQRMTYR